MADGQTPGPNQKKVHPPSQIIHIPLEEFRQCYAKELDKACKMFQAASVSDVKEICPYNKNHRVWSHQIDEHVKKCRRVYQQQMLNEGKEAFAMSCKWNFDHQIIAPELLFHEERCEDGKDREIPWYILSNIGVYFDDFELPPGVNLEDYGPSEEELAERRKGRYLNVVVGSDSKTGKSIPIEELRDSAKTEEGAACLDLVEPGKAEEGAACLDLVEPGKAEEGAACLDLVEPDRKPEKKTERSNVFSDLVRNQQSTTSEDQPQASGSGASSSHAVEEDDGDEEYWESNPNAPRFDYMQHSHNPTRPLYTYPIGLNKSQRRKFVKWNTEWMRRIDQAEAEARRAEEEAEDSEED